MFKTATSIAVVLATTAVIAQTPSSGKPPSSDKSWITASDRYTQMLLDIDKKYSPEQESAEGLAEYDEKISVPTLKNELAERKDRGNVLAKLKSAETGERNRYVAEDLAILVRSTQHGSASRIFSSSTKFRFSMPPNLSTRASNRCLTIRLHRSGEKRLWFVLPNMQG